jgi:predicted nucleic acid-binding protein
MKQLIVSDTSPLIALAKLDCLNLLFCSFKEIHIPDAVYLEATVDRHRPDSQKIDHFLNASAVIHPNENNDQYHQFKALLDEGESQALALATKLQCGILIDERFGRMVAKQHDIPVIGVMAILLQAKASGKIKAVKPLIDTLLQCDYRLSKRVINLVLAKAGE